MNITKNQFQSYVSVQESGIVNMFAINTVSELSGLSKEQIFDIMKNYSQYKEKYLKGGDNL